MDGVCFGGVASREEGWMWMWMCVCIIHDEKLKTH